MLDDIGNNLVSPKFRSYEAHQTSLAYGTRSVLILMPASEGSEVTSSYSIAEITIGTKPSTSHFTSYQERHGKYEP